MKLKVVKGGKDHPVQTSYDTTVHSWLLVRGFMNIKLVHREGNVVIRRHLEGLPLDTFDSVPRPPHNPNTQGLCLSPSSIPMTKLDTHASPPPFLLQRPPLFKQRSWSPDAFRDEAWLRRKGNI
ncbi:hypothetical protein JHK87_004117 [Glycine soja]|nr:hypothetical protein JHK87_004117 [Glycine soja]